MLYYLRERAIYGSARDVYIKGFLLSTIYFYF